MQAETRRYIVRRCGAPPPLEAVAGRLPPEWAAADAGEIAGYHPRGGPHRPAVVFRLLRDDEALHLRFDVQDRYVRSVHTRPQSPVCTDSCVEFFVQPCPSSGYFNLEINAGGTPLLCYIEDPRRRPGDGGFRRCREVGPRWLERVAIAASLPAVVDPEIAAPTAWVVACRLPLALFAAYAGVGGISPGDRWRANFYKCGDKTSHPHWGFWSDIGERCDFHQPARFGELLFA